MEVEAGERNCVFAAVNVVPLIDILLVLLIVFMMIASRQPVSLAVELSQLPTKTESLPLPVSTIVVCVSAHDDVLINQDRVSPGRNWASALS
jgi:biopolymer transport protein ExbD